MYKSITFIYRLLHQYGTELWIFLQHEPERHLQDRCLCSSQHQLAREMLPWLLKNSGSRYVAIMYVALGSSGKIKVNLWSGCKSSDSTITSASSSKLPDSCSLPFYSQLRLHLNMHPFISFTLIISFHFIRQVKITSFIWRTATTPSPDFLHRLYLLYTKGLVMAFFISLRFHTAHSRNLELEWLSNAAIRF